MTDFPFTTDGCSLFPDGKWGGCCVTHDEKYWAGGSALERLKADTELMLCVAGRGFPVIAVIMFLGVRVFGGPRQLLWFRWGYGWKYSRAFTYAKQVNLLKSRST